MSIIIDTTSETMPTFNDPPVNVCYIDGQTFLDPGVYQQHMLMYHGVSVDVRAQDMSIIRAPLNPVIPPPDPYFMPAPGVTLIPTENGNFIPRMINPLPVQEPVMTFTPYQPSIPSSTTGGASSVAGWAWLGIIGGMLAFSGNKKRGKKR